MPSIGFRPLAFSDLVRLHTWLNLPHVMEFYGQRPSTVEEIMQKYGPRLSETSRVYPWIILVDCQPAGYIQWYWLADSPPATEGLCNPVGAAGLDVFIGEPTWVDRGVGSTAIAAFIREVLIGEYAVARILIDPAVSNTRAIRAYEKVGFHRVASSSSNEEPQTYYMLLDPSVSPLP